MRTINDPSGMNIPLVERLIGMSAYEIVKFVAENMDIVRDFTSSNAVPYFETMAEGISQTVAGRYFRTDASDGVGPHPNEMWFYKRTGTTPFYEAMLRATLPVDVETLEEALQPIQEELEETKNRSTHTGTQAISTVSGLQAALDGLQDELADFDARTTSLTFAQISSRTIPAAVKSFMTCGYAADGDGGRAQYREVFGTGLTATRWRTQDADGRWWELDEPTVSVVMLGAKGDYWLNDGGGGSSGSGSVNPNHTDNTAAIQEALDNFKNVYFPATTGLLRTGYYCSVPLILNFGNYLWAKSTMGSEGISKGGVAIISDNGDTILNLRTRNAQRVTIEGLSLWCPTSRNTDGIDVTPLRTTLRDVHILGCRVGIGGKSGVFGEHSNFYNLHIYGCGWGVQRIVDTRWYGGRVAACTAHGIDLVSGCNDNQINVKIDFNEGVGLRASGCLDLTLFIENIDRNFKNGVELAGCSRVVGTLSMARNGKNNTTDADSHFHIRGGCDRVSLHVVSSTGREDDGTGTITPKYFLTLEDTTNKNITFYGDFSGYTTSQIVYLNGAQPAHVDFIGTGGVNQRSSVTRTQAKVSSQVSNGQSTNITFTLPPLPTYDSHNIDVSISARRDDTQSTRPGATLPIQVSRGDTATHYLKTAALRDAFDSGSTYFGTSGSPTVLVAPSIVVEADGSITLTVTFTSSSSLNLRFAGAIK